MATIAATTVTCGHHLNIAAHGEGGDSCTFRTEREACVLQIKVPGQMGHDSTSG
eukprot:m.413157 g.413157  ORF g.413157 m.413157 type:complete len:54 (+) comp29027_c0_seq1:793-954(+)